MKKLLIIAFFLATSLTTLSADGKALFAKCIACHGASGQMKALGRSEVIKGWSKAKVVTALKGYKDGSYGKMMKGIMKGQVATLNDKQMNELGDYISSLK